MAKNENPDPVRDAPIGPAGDNFLIVGVGASAGGIKALREFFSKVPADSNMAYVAILHLSPEFESKLAEIIQMDCRIPVMQIQEDKVRVQPNHVYVIPPNRSLSMADGYLALSARETFENGVRQLIYFSAHLQSRMMAVPWQWCFQEPAPTDQWA